MSSNTMVAAIGAAAPAKDDVAGSVVEAAENSVVVTSGVVVVGVPGAGIGVGVVAAGVVATGVVSTGVVVEGIDVEGAAEPLPIVVPAG